MQIFYTPDIAIKPELPEEEAGHCIRVLRLGEGDEIVLTDGQGSFYKAAISRAHPKQLQSPYSHSSYQKHGPDGVVRGESDGNRDQCDHLFELSFLGA